MNKSPVITEVEDNTDLALISKETIALTTAKDRKMMARVDNVITDVQKQLETHLREGDLDHPDMKVVMAIQNMLAIVDDFQAMETTFKELDKAIGSGKLKHPHRVLLIRGMLKQVVGMRREEQLAIQSADRKLMLEAGFNPDLEKETRLARTEQVKDIVIASIGSGAGTYAMKCLTDPVEIMSSGISSIGSYLASSPCTMGGGEGLLSGMLGSACSVVNETLGVASRPFGTVGKTVATTHWGALIMFAILLVMLFMLFLRLTRIREVRFFGISMRFGQKKSRNRSGKRNQSGKRNRIGKRKSARRSRKMQKSRNLKRSR